MTARKPTDDAYRPATATEPSRLARLRRNYAKEKEQCAMGVSAVSIGRPPVYRGEREWMTTTKTKKGNHNG